MGGKGLRPRGGRRAALEFFYSLHTVKNAARAQTVARVVGYA